MFNKNFYPTPEAVITEMLYKFDINDKVVLEPHGGKGDLITGIKSMGAKEVLTCENNKDLAIIAAQKADRFICSNFFDVTSEMISHVHYIIMNPPFDTADKHILHAIEVAPKGCTIISLCNWETLDNSYYKNRRLLNSKINDLGNKRNLGNVFSTAERKTDVEIGLIELFMPKSEQEDEWDGYLDENDLGEQYVDQTEGVMKHDDIREIVNRYISAVNKFNEVEKINSEMNDIIKPISGHETPTFGAYYTSNNYRSVSRDEFKKNLQKDAWRSVFKKLNMEKYMTKKTMEKINKYVEQQVNVPFTRNNIFKMLEVIVGTHGSRMNEVITEVFNSITQRHHENRFSLEGWKTNSEYMVNKKFIINCYDFRVGGRYGNAEHNWSSYHNDFLDDLTKSMCYVTGNHYDASDKYEEGKVKKFELFREWLNNSQMVTETRTFNERGHKLHGQTYDYKTNQNCGREFGKWHQFGFFTIKMYKKGSLHVKFNDENAWILFNKEAVKNRGFNLASKYTSDYRVKTKGVTLF